MKGRKYILGLIDEAVCGKARLKKACEIVGVSVRTTQRWRKDLHDDGRKKNRFKTSIAFSAEERETVLATVCSPEYRNLPPGQIVPKLANENTYIGSESTIYRILKVAGLSKRRSETKAPKREKPRELVASKSNQVWTWDISYLLSNKKCVFFYLYFILDIWDRSIVGWDVHENESGEHASVLMRQTCTHHNIQLGELAVHQDNGSPMISPEFLSALHSFEIECSYSRPGVSDDNPYSESLFRTAKYRPGYPERFECLEDAYEWAKQFVDWYNNVHLHSGIRFVTPAQRRCGQDIELLENRKATYEAAKLANPARWSGNVRNWERPEVVILNPKKNKKELHENIHI